MRKRRAVIVVTLVGAVAASVWYVRTHAAPMALPAGPVAAFRLNPQMQTPDDPNAPKLYLWEIRETRDLSTSERVELVRLLNQSANYGGSAAKCFTPGMGFRFGTDNDRTDVLICLSCKWARFYRGDDIQPKMLSERGVREWERVYRGVFPNVPSASNAH